MDGERPEAIIGRPSVWRLGSPVDERRGPRHLGDLQVMDHVGKRLSFVMARGIEDDMMLPGTGDQLDGQPTCGRHLLSGGNVPIIAVRK
jgi:hypothetical protein